jgi:hypothetical protein
MRPQSSTPGKQANTLDTGKQQPPARAASSASRLTYDRLQPDNNARNIPPESRPTRLFPAANNGHREMYRQPRIDQIISHFAGKKVAVCYLASPVPSCSLAPPENLEFLVFVSLLTSPFAGVASSRSS